MSAHLRTLPGDTVTIIGSRKIVTYSDPHDNVVHTAEFDFDRQDVTITIGSEEPDFFTPSRSFSIPVSLWNRMREVTA